MVIENKKEAVGVLAFGGRGKKVGGGRAKKGDVQVGGGRSAVSKPAFADRVKALNTKVGGGRAPGARPVSQGQTNRPAAPKVRTVPQTRKPASKAKQAGKPTKK